MNNKSKQVEPSKQTNKDNPTASTSCPNYIYSLNPLYFSVITIYSIAQALNLAVRLNSFLLSSLTSIHQYSLFSCHKSYS